MKTLLAIAVLTAIFASTCGLKCYTCDSTIHTDDCFDQVRGHPTWLNSCASDENFCRTEVHRENGMVASVTRGCTRMCEEQDETDGTVVLCCQSGGCNSAGADADAGSGAVSATMSLIIVFVAAFFSLEILSLTSPSQASWYA